MSRQTLVIALTNKFLEGRIKDMEKDIVIEKLPMVNGRVQPVI